VPEIMSTLLSSESDNFKWSSTNIGTMRLAQDEKKLSKPAFLPRRKGKKELM
jgi:hypothetical protein